MKVLLVTDKIPPEPSTVGMLVLRDAEALRRHGVEVAIFSVTHDKLNGNTVSEKEANGIQYFLFHGKQFHPRWRFWCTIKNPKVEKVFREVVAKSRPDVVHFHNLHERLCFSLLKCAQKNGARVVFTAHDVMTFHYGKLTDIAERVRDEGGFDYRVRWLDQVRLFRLRIVPFRRLIIRHYLSYVDILFAVSNSLQQALTQNSISSVRVLYNGLDLKEWKQEGREVDSFQAKYGIAGKRVVFFGGRISRAKGSEQLINAMETVAETIPNVVLLVAGQVTIPVTRKNFEIVNTGWLASVALRSAYKASDVVVVPSICFDSLPTTAIEAHALGKPVVATCFGGASEIVLDGKSGYIVNPYDILSLARALVTLLADQSKAVRFGQYGKDRVQQLFSIDHHVNQLIQIYGQSGSKNKD